MCALGSDRIQSVRRTSLCRLSANELTADELEYVDPKHEVIVAARAVKPDRMVYLTIDDGPSERMNELLEYLTSRGFGAIFFCRGDNMSVRPDLVIRAIRKGFIIGNHSFNHSDFSFLTENETREQITRTEKIIEELYERAGVKRYAKYFRFPYGSNGSTEDVRKRNQEILREFGFRSPLYTPDRAWAWDVDVQDWRVDESNVTEKMAIALSRLRALQNEGVLDLHDHEANFRLGLFQEICSKVTSMGFYFHDNCHLREQGQASMQDK